MTGHFYLKIAAAAIGGMVRFAAGLVCAADARVREVPPEWVEGRPHL